MASSVLFVLPIQVKYDKFDLIFLVCFLFVWDQNIVKSRNRQILNDVLIFLKIYLFKNLLNCIKDRSVQFCLVYNFQGIWASQVSRLIIRQYSYLSVCNHLSFFLRYNIQPFILVHSIFKKTHVSLSSFLHRLWIFQRMER